MTQNNGNGSTAPIGVHEEISQRLAVITPEQFVAPDLTRGENDHIVAIATDGIKRLFTLRTLLADELDEIAANGRKMAMQNLLTLLKVSTEEEIGRVSKELQTPGSPLSEQHEAVKRNSNDLELKTSLVELVDKMCWLEVRRQHPELTARPTVGVYSDWNLGWREERDEEEDIEDVFRILRISGHGSASDLSAVLGLDGDGH